LEKNSRTLILLLLPQIPSKKLPKNHKIQDHDLFLPYYKVDSRIDNLNKHKLKTRRNSNDDVLTNTSSNSQNRIMIVDDEKDISRLFAIIL
jgi:hypothetical protein